ncbi:unnamed protein product [Rotaria sp. Silwood2]|nr:unnamed protein product [Rotaria sp. Silwood2]CAF2822181.1 unnamed protein product [Rotaria sp. Silwood2]CAF3111997.1 unnamed protein product [Rotaria sp. Silwood2]CAF3279765.1 unnamed protein product [Rotaria sp. Silwood2]CAF4077432.1 unnamed protein product [Rotaria sp. Silwood2]
MEKLSTKTKRNNPKNDDDDGDDDDTLSSHSILSIDPNQTLVNNTGHNLFQLAIKQAHEERRRVKKIRQQNKKSSLILQRQTIVNKTKSITINEIDHLFEEKRLRPSTIKNDLMELYEKSTSRIRSMLDIKQIDHFIQTTQNRKTNEHIK